MLVLCDDGAMRCHGVRAFLPAMMLVVAAACTADGADGAGTVAPATSSPVAPSTATSTPTPTPTPTATSVVPVPTTTDATPTTEVPRDCGALVDGTQELEVLGTTRTFEVRAPAALADGPAAPVIVLFHGFSGTAVSILERTGLGDLAPDGGVVVVAPQALGEPTTWHIGDETWADTEFTDAVLDVLLASPCVDPSSIWLAGFSAGSAWTGVYGCSHPDALAGLLMHSGLAPPICPADADLDLFVVHGTDDPVVPFSGGDQAVGGDSVMLSPVPESVAGWAAAAGCDPAASVAAAGDDVLLSTWTGCAGDHTVVFEAVAGLGHVWAGGADAVETLNPGCVLVARLTGDPDPVTSCLA